jgi:hypothetical protein
MTSATTEWSVNQLRFTGFVTPTVKVEASEWWEKLTGDTPENAISSPKAATREVRGMFQGGSLTLRVSPLRFDWLFSPEDLINPTATIGLWPAASGLFVELMAKWIASPDCPPLLRLAFGAVLLSPVESREDGYEKLDDFLPAVELDSKSSDFSYQINRPRQSKITGLKVNRLTKWSVSAVQPLLAAASGVMVGPAEHALRVELDINTAADNLDEIPKATLVDQLHELAALGDEIVHAGDIP